MELVTILLSGLTALDDRMTPKKCLNSQECATNQKIVE